MYDFSDFADIVNVKGSAIVMAPTDFSNIGNGVRNVSYTNKPRLADAKIISFRKNSTQIYWKNSIDGGYWESGEFLKKKLRQEIISENGHTFITHEVARGIPAKKQDDIVMKLCPMMPPITKKIWW